MSDGDKKVLNAMLAQRLAAQGKDALNNPVTNFVAGWKRPQLGAQAQQAQPAEQPKPQKPSKPAPQAKETDLDKLQQKLFERMTPVYEAQARGVLQPSDWALPGAALRPEVQQAFEPYGGVFQIDVRNLSAEEMNGLRMLLDPKWVASKTNAGANLTEDEKRAALKRRG